jgi:two-component system phosphate regulon response regulator PhoB/two-component system alkaline phosphatase synthesis response regulator PhoP
MIDKASTAKVIAVVDDEPDIVELVSIHLKKARFEVLPFTDASSFMKALNKRTPDLIILDLMLPDADGMDICKHLKNKDSLSSIPIIMLTARSEETDKILGLELGADDYVTKPFSPRELVARVKAVLRREVKKEGKKITVGRIMQIDLARYEVMVEGKKISLTSTEFRLLHILAQRIGWVYSRNQLLNALWGENKIVIDRTIDVHINHLREKLGKAGSFIKNIRGIGYKLDV